MFWSYRAVPALLGCEAHMVDLAMVFVHRSPLPPSKDVTPLRSLRTQTPHGFCWSHLCKRKILSTVVADVDCPGLRRVLNGQEWLETRKACMCHPPPTHTHRQTPTSPLRMTILACSCQTATWRWCGISSELREPVRRVKALPNQSSTGCPGDMSHPLLASSADTVHSDVGTHYP